MQTWFSLDFPAPTGGVHVVEGLPSCAPGWGGGAGAPVEGVVVVEVEVEDVMTVEAGVEVVVVAVLVLAAELGGCEEGYVWVLYKLQQTVCECY